MTPRLLANENFPLPSVDLLRADGYDVVAIAESSKSLRDSEILSLAVAENRWVLTFDRDYGSLIFVKGLPAPPALLYLRLPSYRPEGPGQLLIELLKSPALLAGQFVVIESDGLRKRPMP